MKNIEKKLWSRAKFGAIILSFVPFLKEIAINGSLAHGNVNNNSDVDFFIITEKNRLWIVRFLSVIILDLFFLRAKNNNHQGKICLNHFLSSEDYMLTLKNEYNAYQYSNLRVVYQLNNTHNEFISKNEWMKKYCHDCKTQFVGNKPNIIKLIVEFFLEGFANQLEKKLFNFQLKKIQENPFFHLKESLIQISSKEFYYYTDVSSKYRDFSSRKLDNQV
jgi:predicted nucleotidyltransferase